MTADRPADLVLRGGRDRHDGRRPHAGERARRPRRADRGGRAATRRSGRWIGPRTRVIELRGRTVTPGLRGRPRPSGPRRARRMLALRPARRRAGSRPLARRSSRPTPRTHPDEPWIRGGGWSMADFPGGIAAPRGPRPDRPRPAGLPRPAATATAPGSTRRRSSWPAIDRRHARSRPTAGSSATPTARRSARSRRARWTSSTRLLPDDTPDELVAGAAPRPGATSTRSASPHWQDAIVEPHDARSAPTRRWPAAAS